MPADGWCEAGGFGEEPGRPIPPSLVATGEGAFPRVASANWAVPRSLGALAPELLAPELPQ